eukprot:TRINITY_DN1238_c1_g1_i1.p1 TRINITY_DN1238_c1_g1~~TRINITY_DN1238_c1_g1_i1.p1  ORF type:complete len:321 (+),score=69.15 TRINITY_DN1238_c1_g1_i1:181-1143(+)
MLQYGAADIPGLPVASKRDKQRYFVPAYLPALARRRLNDVAIMLAVVLPCALFAGALWLLASQVRYFHSTECLWLVACALLLPVALSWRARQSRRRSTEDAERLEAAWIAFMAFSCFVAWMLAVVLGEYNYVTHTAKANTMMDLNTVEGVNPTTKGTAYLDASVLHFAEGSFVDESKAMGYKDYTTYCVAPVGIGNLTLGSYGFWAVGTDCCNPFGGQFWCGKAGIPGALTGLRLLDDADRPYYRLAVQQAQAEYGIQVQQSPIFVRWADSATESSHSEASLWASSRSFLAWAITIFVVCQSVLVYFVVSYYATFLEPIV